MEDKSKIFFSRLYPQFIIQHTSLIEDGLCLSKNFDDVFGGDFGRDSRLRKLFETSSLCEFDEFIVKF